MRLCSIITTQMRGNPEMYVRIWRVAAVAAAVVAVVILCAEMPSWPAGRWRGIPQNSDLCIVGTKSLSAQPTCHPFPLLPLCATMAHTAAHFVLFSALAIVAAASTAQLETHSGAYSICRANTLYKVEFNVTGVPNDNYIALDDPSMGVVDVDCDYDQTALNLKFDSNDHVLKFVAPSSPAAPSRYSSPPNSTSAAARASTSRWSDESSLQNPTSRTVSTCS